MRLPMHVKSLAPAMPPLTKKSLVFQRIRACRNGATPSVSRTHDATVYLGQAILK